MLIRILLCSILISSVAQARIFDFGKETFAAYFALSGGKIGMGTRALENEVPDTVEFSGDQAFNYSGEVGFLYSRSVANLRFGVEILKPNSLNTSGVEAGVNLYDVQSDMLVLVPKLMLEWNLRDDRTSRSYIGIGAGLANLSFKNTYSLSTDGMARFPGVLDHSVQAKAETIQYNLVFGHESHFTDTTTLAFEVGYRRLNFDQLKYSKETSTFSGTHSSGDTLKDLSGADRKFDLSGVFISIGFRFFL